MTTTTDNRVQLANEILVKFTPMAFRCDCLGTHSECARVMREDASAWAQHDVVKRIAAYIRNSK
jgi:hypothetical protein